MRTDSCNGCDPFRRKLGRELRYCLHAFRERGQLVRVRQPFVENNVQQCEQQERVSPRADK